MILKRRKERSDITMSGQVMENFISEIGGHFNIKGLALNEKGKLGFKAEKLGYLRVESMKGEALMISLSREYQHGDMKLYLKALEACHYNQVAQLKNVYGVGLIKENQIMFSTTIQSDKFTIPDFLSIVEQLKKLHEKL